MNSDSGAASAVLKTERLTLRKVEVLDAAFVLNLLNQHSFIRYIGDRGVRDLDQARDYIESRFVKSYSENGFGMYGVELSSRSSPFENKEVSGQLIGICGFVLRETLPGPDIGFAFLPEFEGRGFGLESASAVMRFGKENLGFDKVYAITSLDNDASIRLLEKLGFNFVSLTDSPDGQPLRLFSYRYEQSDTQHA